MILHICCTKHQPVIITGWKGVLVGGGILETITWSSRSTGPALTHEEVPETSLGLRRLFCNDFYCVWHNTRVCLRCPPRACNLLRDMLHRLRPYHPLTTLFSPAWRFRSSLYCNFLWLFVWQTRDCRTSSRARQPPPPRTHTSSIPTSNSFFSQVQARKHNERKACRANNCHLAMGRLGVGGVKGWLGCAILSSSGHMAKNTVSRQSDSVQRRTLNTVAR